MSKKAFREAFNRAVGGEVDAAVEAMARLDKSFLRGRLEHLMKWGGPDAALAGQLHAKLFPPKVAEGAAAKTADVVPASLPPELLQALPPSAIDLDRPEEFLAWSTRASTGSKPFRLESLSVAQIWGLVGLAALAQPARADRPSIVLSGKTAVGRFAHALGLDALVEGRSLTGEGERGRTVRLHRVYRVDQIENTAREMGRLIVPDTASDNTFRVIRYVLVELLRNVVQHSEDPLGGVAAAQMMNLGPYNARPMIQVAVADAGIGIPESLQRMHSSLDDPRAALERSLWPHISGAFPEGLTGTQENAGLGLFFIAEMAKMTGGRLLLATRGASLMLDDHTGKSAAVMPRFLTPRGMGFPGTLVTFELPMETPIRYDELIRTIGERARERTPQRAVHHWIEFEPPHEPAAVHVRVQDLAENTSRAAIVAREQVIPTIVRKQRVVLDFSGLEICTQSYLHALLYDAVRLAWATRTTIHVVGADAPIRSGIEFLEAYALGG